MKEKPILFSTEMVKAILDGRKTMTRRVIKDLHPESKFLNLGVIGFNFVEPEYFDKADEEKMVSVMSCPYGQPGDILWVRESWAFRGKSNQIAYKANFHKELLSLCGKWKPSIHMPKTAARIYLQVEAVRVERLHDISEADAKSEGIKRIYNTTSEVYVNYLFWGDTATPIESFKSLWSFINGPESWEQNPWVWVISFKVLSTTVRPDFLPALK